MGGSGGFSFSDIVRSREGCESAGKVPTRLLLAEQLPGRGIVALASPDVRRTDQPISLFRRAAFSVSCVSHDGDHFEKLSRPA
jgi:hypothetical protein